MKVSRYNHFVRSFLDDVWLGFNAMSGAYLVLDDQGLGEALSLIEALEERGQHPTPLTGVQADLVEGGFVVDDAFDELARFRARYEAGKREVTGLSLTVAPTVACNFDCSYCFQQHPNQKMTPQDVARLLDYVDERLQPDSSLAVTWFGGEPLIAWDVIQELAVAFERLGRKRGCDFQHSMITNGYLLTPDKARFLAEVGRFTYAQITLDGPPDLHDQRRPTVGGRGSFDRILDNIRATAAIVPISVRVNVDRRNVARLDELLDELDRRGVREQVSVYLGHVWEYTSEVEGVEDNQLTKEEFANVQTQFAFTKLRRGFAVGSTLPRPRRGNLCIADHPNGHVVAPGGLVFKCWNEVSQDASHASGRYDHAQDAQTRQTDGPQPGRPGLPILPILAVQDTKRHEWESYNPFTHKPCETCPVAPLCMAGCAWEARKAGPFDPGYCTPLRYNLADQLRLYHLETTVRAALPTETPPEPDVDACTVPPGSADTPVLALADEVSRA